jgi:hypothetical protein
MSYTSYSPYGYTYQSSQAGQFSDATIKTSDSFAAEEVIGFGLPLMRGSNPDRQAKIFNGGITTKFLGISGYSILQINGTYAPKDMVTVVTMGRVWIPLVGTQLIVAGQTAYLNITDDIITGTYVANETIAIGRFLTEGNTTPSVPILFELELEVGFEDGL